MALSKAARKALRSAITNEKARDELIALLDSLELTLLSVGATAVDALSTATAIEFLLSGEVTVDNGASSVTVDAATLGDSYGGQPAFAVLAEADGALHVLHCTWDVDDLVITLSGNTTATRQVYYWVDGRV